MCGWAYHDLRDRKDSTDGQVEALLSCRRRVEWGGVMIPEAEMCDFLGPNPKALFIEEMLQKLGQRPA